MKPFRTFLLCWWILVAVFSPSICFPANPEEEIRLPLAMEVFLKKPQSRVYALQIHLTNVSDDVVAVNIRDLPWNPPNDSKWFSMIRMDGNGGLVEQSVQDWKLGSQVIKLVPGESIQDAMVLNPRLPSLLDDVAQFGVQLRWDCPPTDLKFVCQENALNTITIPKSDAGKPDTYSIDASVCQKLEQAIGLINIPEGHTVLFLLTPESVMVDRLKIHALLFRVDEYVRQCQPSWTNSWGVSFFTDAQYAGFLSGANQKADFKRGVWQQVNIGQYSSQTRTLFRFPWIKKRSDEVYMSVYR